VKLQNEISFSMVCYFI